MFTREGQKENDCISSLCATHFTPSSSQLCGMYITLGVQLSLNNSWRNLLSDVQPEI